MAEKMSDQTVDEALYNEYTRLQGELEHCIQRLDESRRKQKAMQAHVQQLEQIQAELTHSAAWRASFPWRYFASKAKRVAGSLARWRENAKANRFVKRNFFGTSIQPDRFVPVEQLHKQIQTPLQNGPLFSILVPVYNTPPLYLQQMIDSVRNQTYPRWQLCLANASDGAQGPHLKAMLEAAAKEEARILVTHLEENRGIAKNTNAAFALATGDFLCFLDHDDLLYPTALYEIAKTLEENPTADVLYTDENHFCDETFSQPLYKPDWSRSLLYSHNYITHFLVVRASLLAGTPPLDAYFDGAQDYDLILRLSEKTEHIVHVPQVLYSWRSHEGSTAANTEAKPYAHEAGRRALDAHLKRQYSKDAYAEDASYQYCYLPRFPLLPQPPMASIIILMKDRVELTEQLVQSILEKTEYPQYEILILDNQSKFVYTQKILQKLQALPADIRVIKADFPFNWSRLNNFGAGMARGDMLVFMNNDMRVITPDWLLHLAENAMQPDVGVVGPLLLYADDTIQHAGVVVGKEFGRHLYAGAPAQHMQSPFVSPMVSRDVLAVTGACQALSRRAYQQIGPYDERFIVCWSDIEYCLRAGSLGLRVIYNAGVRLYHDEAKSRGRYYEGKKEYIPESDVLQADHMLDTYLASGKKPDKYFNPNLQINNKNQPMEPAG